MKDPEKNPELTTNTDDTPPKWRDTSWLVFVSAFIVSAAVHALFLGLVISGYFEGRGEDASIEWMADAGDLSGLGMSSGDGRWADVNTVQDVSDSDKKGNDDTSDSEEEDSPPTPDTDIPEPTEKQEEPEPQPEPEPEPPAPPKEEKSKPVEVTKPTPPKPRPRNPFVRRAGEGLPGVNTAGPSKVPDMRGYGPGNVVYAGLIRLDRIRGTAFEEITRQIIRRVPDYRIALDHTGVDPVKELDALFTASPRPRYVQYTFLAVRYSMPQSKLKERLNGRFADLPPWRKEHGLTLRNIVPDNSAYEDPRQVVLARQGLAVIARPEWISRLVGKIAEDSTIGQSLHLAPEQRRPTLIDGLMHIENAMSNRNTLIALSARGIKLLVPGLGRLQFEGIKFALRDAKHPKVNIDIQFADTATAKQFADSCESQKQNILNGLPMLVRFVAAPILNPLKCSQDGDFVSIVGQYTVQQINQIVGLAMPFLPNIPQLNDLPAPPPPPAPPKPVAPADAVGSTTEPAQPTPTTDPSTTDGVDNTPITDTPSPEVPPGTSGDGTPSEDDTPLDDDAQPQGEPPTEPIVEPEGQPTSDTPPTPPPPTPQPSPEEPLVP